MSASCCGGHDIKVNDHNKAFKVALWIALGLNLAMFFVEVIFGVLSHSLSLKADAIDFLGDSANYFATLFVLNAVVTTKAKVSLLKALFMFGFGVWVFIEAVMRFNSPEIPHSFTMGWVGVLALVVNIIAALILYKFKDGDSNMQSVWLCSRNDAIGNIAVVLASFGVYTFSSKWPDLLVALFMVTLSITAAYRVLKIAKKEIMTAEKECTV